MWRGVQGFRTPRALPLPAESQFPQTSTGRALPPRTGTYFFAMFTHARVVSHSTRIEHLLSAT
jgi:hypothetical protein